MMLSATAWAESDPAGTKLPGTWGTLKTRDMCLEALASDVTKNEGKIQLTACTGKDNQLWSFVSGEKIVNKAGGFCLDAHRDQMSKNGGTVQIYQCHGKDNQIWTQDANKQLRLANNKCLDINGNLPYANGSRVQVYDCNAQGPTMSNDAWAYTVAR